MLDTRSVHSEHFTRICRFALLVLAVGVILFTIQCNRRGSEKGQGGEVHGFVVAKFEGQIQKGSSPVFLPDTTVYLKNAESGNSSVKVTTDLKGWYAIPKMPAGLYELCYEADGYVPGCSSDRITINSFTVFPPLVRIAPRQNYFAGRVMQADGNPGRFSDPAFGVNAQTKVSWSDGGAEKTVRANTAGLFVISGLTSSELKLKATCEAAFVEKTVSVSEFRTATDSGEFGRLVLANSSPNIKSVIATNEGRFVRQVPPGTTVNVKVTADDNDKDKLHYTWRESQSSDSRSINDDSPTINWTLPKASGLFSLYVLVRDDKGGYDLGKVDISTSGPQVLFSGRVSGTDGELIDGAKVAINDMATTTSKDGYFFIQVPQESNRYVFNISKLGYALYSKILFEGAVEQRITMVKAQTTTIDPSQRIAVTEDLKGKEKAGASVQIQPNTLVDIYGKRATGSLRLSISTIDVRDPVGRLPGDFGALTAAGRDVRLETYGAADIQITDDGGNSFNLAPGSEATVRIPVDKAQLAKAPAEIDLWFYDTKSGLWRQEGKATLFGDTYQARVKHFSVVNVDVAKIDAACMRIHTDTTTIPVPYQLKITIPTSTGVDQEFTRPVNEAESVIVRLPPNEPITLQAFASDHVTLIELSKQTVDSGAAIPGVASTTPMPPYPQCHSDAYLAVAPADSGFLNYIGEDTDATANAYYAAVDETGVDRSTLAAWKTLNGFDTGDDASAVFFNNGDLGFGRSMHMKRRVVGSDTYIAYYVSNYPNVEAARLNIGLIATVAMEYSPHGSGVPYTKFFVFNAAGARVNRANLDGRGDKYVPRLCIICHAGTYTPPDSTNHGNVGARFIPFDLESYLYSGFDAAFSRAGQEGDPHFKGLNRGVHDHTNISSGARQLIEGWYGGSALPSATPDDNFFPPAVVGSEPGWPGPGSPSGDLYKFVVKSSCRTCHVNRDAPLSWVRFDGSPAVAPDPASGFKQYGEDYIKYLVCGPARVMPQAKVPYIRFWASGNPHRPTVLLNSGAFAAYPCPAP